MEFIISKWCAVITSNGEDKYTAAVKTSDMTHEFRLLDDDGEVYAYGWSTDGDSEDAFEPLDYYASHYGVTEIQYKVNGSWETL